MIHTHQRPDRDNYLYVKTNNVSFRENTESVPVFFHPRTGVGVVFIARVFETSSVPTRLQSCEPKARYLFQRHYTRQDYKKYDSKWVEDYGLPYDFDSVMHYPVIKNGPFLARREHASQSDRMGSGKLSKGDAEVLNRAYCGSKGRMPIPIPIPPSYPPIPSYPNNSTAL